VGDDRRLGDLVLEVEGESILMDCGLFQGRREEARASEPMRLRAAPGKG